MNIVREFEHSSGRKDDSKKNSVLDDQNKINSNFGKANNNHDDTMWNNPFAPPEDNADDDEIINVKPLNLNSRKNENLNRKSSNYGSLLGYEEKSEEIAGIRGSRSMCQGGLGIVGGFSLTEGGLDEAAEHEVIYFMKKMTIVQVTWNL